MTTRVLVAEDDAKSAELIRRYLRSDGHDVLVVHDGRAAIEQARSWHPDLLVLDIMMPGADGLAVCRTLRQDDVAVLMLTARSDEDDLLLGLDVGADDYMTKPYSPRELTARVRVLLRRARRAPPGDRVVRTGALTVDRLRHVVAVEGRQVPCTPAEFAILAAMVAQPERVFTRPQLLEHIHGIDRYISQRTIDAHMLNLRKKIEPDPARPAYLLTVFGVGYKVTDGAPGRAPRGL